MDTLGFLLSKSSILPPIEAEKYKKKLMKEATGLKKDSMFDDDDYDPDNRYAYAFYLPPLYLSVAFTHLTHFHQFYIRVRLINPRVLWGRRHLCEDGTMPVDSFMDKCKSCIFFTEQYFSILFFLKLIC